MSAPEKASVALHVEVEGRLYRLEISRKPDGDAWLAMLDGMPIEVDARQIQPGVLSLIAGGRSFRCVLSEGPTETVIQVDGQVEGQRFPVSIEDPRSLTERRRKVAASGGQQVIKAPMPGRIIRLLVQPGEDVAAHQGVIVIEAMKMQNELKAARAGRVAEIKAKACTTVAAGDVLLTIQ